MKGLRPLSQEVDTLLMASRGVLPLAPSVEARVLARAAPAAELPAWVSRRPAPWPRSVFAAAATLVITLGAAAYAARSWFEAPAASPMPAVPVASGETSARRHLPTVAAVRESDIVAPSSPPARRSRGKSRATAARQPTIAELQLLLSVREDVTHGDFAGALSVIAEHERRFRNGGLVEEREALRVKSLAGLGRHADAQRAALRFHELFPNSVLLSTFERMTEPTR